VLSHESFAIIKLSQLTSQPSSTATPCLTAPPLQDDQPPHLQRRHKEEELITPVILDELVDAIISAPPKQPPYVLSLCALTKNESPQNLLEWVLYHYLLGFEKIILYDNNHHPNKVAETRSTIQPLIDRGVVEHLIWPGALNVAQRLQIADCFQNQTGTTKWMANFDMDEYLVITDDRPPFDHPLLGTSGSRGFLLHHHLSRLEAERCGGFIMQRIEFTSDSHLTRPVGLTMEEYTKARPIGRYEYDGWCGIVAQQRDAGGGTYYKESIAVMAMSDMAGCHAWVCHISKR